MALDFVGGSACVSVFLGLVVLDLFTFPVIKNHKLLHRKAGHDPYQGIPIQDTVKGAQDIYRHHRFRCLNLLLLICFINYTESYTVGNISIHVTGQQGENATLACNIEDRDIFHVILTSLGRNIPVCEMKNCSGRFFKKGSCDIFIKDLHLSDAGKYILRVFYNNDQTEVERQIRTYQLHIHDEISVKTGEELKLDVLLINADKVEKNSSGEWTEVWTRGHGVQNDRLDDSDGNLTINKFKSTDTGTYRVLDSEGEILIMVTVTESGTQSVGERKDGTEHMYWRVGLPVILVLVLVGVIVFVVIKKRQRLNEGYSQGSQSQVLDSL
ncbi:uncharacterized protein LOC127500695 [Ctenopharyngodon idella]|uniref:uncharacterized protein LOC127500695 n=1 Tax=Ctenopharyngodon idella TaxID=7959 RepID=UPI0022326E5D|nr:uncharacterized protein LOC127500695 [Ctenopharyngodon idella]